MKKKRLLSMAMALCLVLGSAAALPKNAFVDSTNITASAANTATSGKCGENVSWSLKDGVLTISGSGKMTDYHYDDSPFYNREDIKSVVIKSGVTSIGYDAFRDCSSLTSVTIPSSVTSIGSYAFEYCKNFTSITIPSSVTSIGEGVFRRCSSLTSVTIPSSVTSIGLWAFDSCSSLTSITIPSSVTSIGHGAFEYCENLTSITIPKSVTSIGSDAFWETKWLENQQKKNPLVVVNGILIDGTKCSGKVTIPSSVTSIGHDAFRDCSSLTGVTIPNSVKSISGYAFAACDNLTNLVIPNSVKYIDIYAFLDCKNLESIVIPNSVTRISECAFMNCSSLTSITIPNSVTSIGDSAFDGCSSLTSVTIPNSVTSIGDSAFYNCKSLKSVTIPSSVTSIGGWAFGYNSDGSKITKIDGFTVHVTSGSVAEKYAKSKGFIIVTRLSGSTRFETAVEISKAGFPSGSKTVVLAYGLNYADALAGVSLAKAKNAPILLTAQSYLPSETLAEIKRLKATDVIILGGTGAVGTEVEKALTDNKLNIERIAGKSRFETATKIAQKMQTLGGNKAPEDVFFVYYNDFADALSVSTVAAIKDAPVIYLMTDGELDSATSAYLASVKGKVKNAYVIGGTGVISDAMMKKAGDALGVKPTRVFGKNRFETCVAVNNNFKSVLNGDTICIATGLDFPDALAGGVFAAKNKAPLLLINGKAATLTLSDTQQSYLTTKAPKKLYVFGGTGVVPDSHIQTVAAASV